MHHKIILPYFQLEAMEANSSSYLFATDFNIEENTPISNNVELDHALLLFFVIVDCLTFGATIGNRMQQLVKKVQSSK